MRPTSGLEAEGWIGVTRAEWKNIPSKEHSLGLSLALTRVGDWCGWSWNGRKTGAGGWGGEGARDEGCASCPVPEASHTTELGLL